MARSVRASKQGLSQAEAVFNRRGWTQEYLAGATQSSRPTVSNFFARRPVEKRLFQAICTELGLDWTDIAELGLDELPAIPQAPTELVQTIRRKVHDRIAMQCGTMRVLDMSQPIALNDIYTTVTVFESVRGRQRQAIAHLMQPSQDQKFSRLGTIQTERIPGSAAVERYSKLIILGKPGAGKTTFLKWIAMQCNSGRGWVDQVPIFVALKAFAEAKGEPDLLSYIQKQWAECGVEDPQAAETVLQQGRALLLLDGIDEVRELEHDRLLQEVQAFSTRFHTCRFVMTCRNAAQEYTFEQFTEVEIAEFDQQQIQDFVTKWFAVKADSTKAARFMQKLQDNQWIEDIATNSLLLTLLCLVFEEAADFSPNRVELLREGLNILLKKWDAKRNIKREVLQQGSEVYQNLSLQGKEALLGQIAFTTFEQGNYFFKQSTVEQYITDFFCTFPNSHASSQSLTSLEIDSEAILKSIEAQHGLLIERAWGIYSFSHLVFQEYFTAKQIANTSVIQGVNGFQALVPHITEKRWREVFLLTVAMLPSADELLLSMKAHADWLLSGEQKLQQFLAWLKGKAELVESSYKRATVRAHYAFLVTDRPIARALTRSMTNDAASQFARDNAFDTSSNIKVARARVISGNFSSIIAETSSAISAIALAVDVGLVMSNDISSIDSTFSIDAVSETILSAINRAIALALDPALERRLQSAKEKLPGSEVSPTTYKEWWKHHGFGWTQHLREAQISYRNLGHDWQFDEAQVALLDQYYGANLLLVDCLNSSCCVGEKVREEIESALLLPAIC